MYMPYMAWHGDCRATILLTKAGGNIALGRQSPDNPPDLAIALSAQEGVRGMGSRAEVEFTVRRFHRIALLRFNPWLRFHLPASTLAAGPPRRSAPTHGVSRRR